MASPRSGMRLAASGRRARCAPTLHEDERTPAEACIRMDGAKKRRLQRALGRSFPTGGWPIPLRSLEFSHLRCTAETNLNRQAGMCARFGIGDDAEGWDMGSTGHGARREGARIIRPGMTPAFFDR